MCAYGTSELCATATKTICQLHLLWHGKLYMPEQRIFSNALNALECASTSKHMPASGICLDVLQEPKAYARTTRRSRKVGASGISFQDAFRSYGTPKHTPEEPDTYANWVQLAYGFSGRSTRKQACAKTTRRPGKGGASGIAWTYCSSLMPMPA